MNDIREFYLNQRLSPARLESLKEVCARKRWVNTRAALGLAAVFLVGVFVGKFSAVQPVSDLGLRIAQDISYHYSEDLPVQLSTTSFVQLPELLDEFKGHLTQKIVGDLESRFRLTGVKYCSLQGNAAAQLQVEQRSDGSSGALYLMPMTPSLAEIEPESFQAPQISISLWRNSGLLFGLAQFK